MVLPLVLIDVMVGGSGTTTAVAPISRPDVLTADPRDGYSTNTLYV
jgi:hypothetical protein